MPPMPIHIELSPAEARLCRDAAKLARDHCGIKNPPFLDAGEQRLERGQWYDMQRWLEWRYVDLENEATPADRRASNKLSIRIEGVIARYDAVNRVEKPASEPVKVQKELFAGAGT